MKVKELIKQLESMDEHKIVFVNIDEYHCRELKFVEEQKEEVELFGY